MERVAAPTAVEPWIGHCERVRKLRMQRISRLDQLVDTMIKRLASAGRLDDTPAKVRPI